jgi:EAL domain-containing protein (putative c-di-GMP-specific phosphodiesterase class I)
MSDIIQFPVRKRQQIQASFTADVVDFFGPGQIGSVNVLKNHMLTSAEAWDALAENRVVVHYQPQYDLRTKTVFALDAFARLLDQEGQVIDPERYIGLAESSGLVVPLGRKLIDQACADLAMLREQGMLLQHMAIRISTRQLELDTGLLEYIDQKLERYALDYHDLSFEVPANQYIDVSAGGYETLRELVQHGSGVTVDGFGLSHASQLHRTDLRISMFRLDADMVRQLESDPITTKVVRHLLNLANDLDVNVVAAGIESSMQEDLLLAFGCLFGQGDVFSAPVPTHALLTRYVTEADYIMD